MSKRIILIDTDRRPLTTRVRATVVHPAFVQDRDGGKLSVGFSRNL